MPDVHRFVQLPRYALLAMQSCTQVAALAHFTPTCSTPSSHIQQHPCTTIDHALTCALCSSWVHHGAHSTGHASSCIHPKPTWVTATLPRNLSRLLFSHTLLKTMSPTSFPHFIHPKSLIIFLKSSLKIFSQLSTLPKSPWFLISHGPCLMCIRSMCISHGDPDSEGHWVMPGTA